MLAAAGAARRGQRGCDVASAVLSTQAQWGTAVPIPPLIQVNETAAYAQRTPAELEAGDVIRD